jgi:hypothetical protein
LVYGFAVNGYGYAACGQMAVLQNIKQAIGFLTLSDCEYKAERKNKEETSKENGFTKSMLIHRGKIQSN